jgi:hypothetical protein
MARGGKRTGAGRKPGAVNVRTQEAVARAEATGLLPHELLCAWAQGREIGGVVLTSVRDRIDCAKAAAPFYAPQRSASTVTSITAETGVPRASEGGPGISGTSSVRPLSHADAPMELSGRA